MLRLEEADLQTRIACTVREKRTDQTAGQSKSHAKDPTHHP